MIDLKSQTLEEMTATLKEMGEPAFRGKQVFTWLHKGVTSFDEMSNLSKPLREKLKEQCYITAPSVARKQVSKLDGTVKSCGSCWTATVSRRWSCSTTMETLSVFPRRWAAGWGALSALPPSLAR